MKENDFRKCAYAIINAAEHILPIGVDNPDKALARLGAAGYVIDTYEWLVKSVMSLKINDTDGLLKWYNYICQKAHEKGTRVYIELLEEMIKVPSKVSA